MSTPRLQDVEQRIHDTLKRTLASAVVRRSERPDDLILDLDAEWTNALLNSLLILGEAEHGLTVYPRRLYFSRDGTRGRNAKYDVHPHDDGEYLVDACWTNYPRRGWSAQLRHGLIRKPRIVLACESEWTADIEAVLQDFAKLTDLDATMKVMLFAFTPPRATFDDVANLCAAAASARRVEPREDGYLLLGWPVGAAWGTSPTTGYLQPQ